MKRKGNQVWGSGLGMPAVGMLVFWASLPATFAENDAAGTAVRETGTRGRARAEPAVGSDMTGYKPGSTPAGRGVICEFEDQAHCQLNTGQWIFPSDRFQGTRRADDFRPSDSPIRRICWNFGFVTESPPPECYDNPPQDFEIHIYEDSFGFPETVIPGSPGPVAVDRSESLGGNTWNFSAPVGGAGGIEVDPGECYWLEITGMGDDDCATLWSHSVDGNNYGVRDDNGDWTAADIRDNDTVWCIDTGIVMPTIPGTNGGCGDLPVACCHRGARGTTCDQRGFRGCSDVGSFGFPYSVCGTFECPDPPNDLCTSDPSGIGPPDTAASVCLGDPMHPEWGEWTYWNGAPGDQLGQCDDWPGSAGFGQVCNPQTEDCREPSTATCRPDPGEAYECWFDGDNRLASTDGPVGGGACGNDNAMQADVWWKIIAPCWGRAVVTMCDGEWEYDGMLSVYGDNTANLQCPGPGPINDDLIECNDDYCRGSGTVEGVHWDAVRGAVYLLRQAGWSATEGLADAGQGKAQFHVGFFCAPPPPPFPLELPASEEHHARKHRFISVDATTNGVDPVSIKVEIAEMNRCQNDLRRSCVDNADCRTVCLFDPDIHSCGSGSICPSFPGGPPPGPCIPSGPCVPHPDVGMSWYVQEPQTRGADCPHGMCDEEDYYAKVGPDLYVSDWKDECEDAGHIPGWTGGCATLHIGDCEIVPGVKYNVYACDQFTGTKCSPPLAVETTRKPELVHHYGDTVGVVDPGNLCCYGPPDGYTNIHDVSAWQRTVQNWGTTNPPQAHPTWIALFGDAESVGIPPNYILSVTDLFMIKRAWEDALPYENDFGGKAPGDCP